MFWSSTHTFSSQTSKQKDHHLPLAWNSSESVAESPQHGPSCFNRNTEGFFMEICGTLTWVSPQILDDISPQILDDISPHISRQTLREFQAILPRIWGHFYRDLTAFLQRTSEDILKIFEGQIHRKNLGKSLENSLKNRKRNVWKHANKSWPISGEISAMISRDFWIENEWRGVGVNFWGIGFSDFFSTSPVDVPRPQTSRRTVW